MKFFLNRFNSRLLPSLPLVCIENGIKNLKIVIAAGINDFPCFQDLTPYIYKLSDNESFLEISLINFPYCVISEIHQNYIGSESETKGEKIPECAGCRFNNRCFGFPPGYFAKYGCGEVKPLPDLPVEVMVEIESRCNFHCRFCFNRNTFAIKNREIKIFSTDYARKIIRGIADSGINTIRFTGGEPLLRKDIFNLFKFSKSLNLDVWLNTNGSLVSRDNIKNFKNLVDNILIPIESGTDKSEDKITGFKNSLNKKIEAIKLSRKIGIPVLRVGTVVSKDIIDNLNKIEKYILGLPIDEWEFYRPISLSGTEKNLSPVEINKLADKIIKLRKHTNKKIIIGNAIPFCAIDNPNKLNKVCNGAIFEDGHSRLVIDPRGFVKPHYFLDKNIGSPLKILKAWQHPFMKKMRNLEFLPRECNGCCFKFICRGGSRFESMMKYGSYNGRDPLADFSNKISYI